MINKEWSANDYAIGAYIQSTIAEQYLSQIHLNPTDSVLDIGCGDGSFSKKIIEKIPLGHFMGIDASQNMLELAKKTTRAYPNVTFEPLDVIDMKYSNQFNYIVSFWCLQWSSNIEKAFKAIYQALMSGGKIMALFPTGDDPFMTTYLAVKNSGQFPQLDDFKPPVNYNQLHDLQNKIAHIPYKMLNIQRIKQSLTLPSLDVFRKFVKGIAFYNGQISEDMIRKIQDAMVDAFECDCKLHHHGEYIFHFSIYYVTAKK